NDFGIKLFSINRIDRETSGILLFAKSGEIASKFHKLFQLRNIYKEYIVYVTGEFPEYKACRGEIVKDENSKIRKKKKFIFSENFTCSTEFYNLESKFLFSKLKVIPLTGKIHQIRATLFSIGFPVVGDKIYGEDENYFLDFIEGKPIPEFPIARQALHSHKIKFIHPVTKVVIEIISPEPEDMKNIFKQAEK
ncbi:MAG: RNA pseudouridine synthase, partial [Leptospiraceae bacterium]|nr:RNA pseudouridine synthase [Leptospiraceae bacterium]